MHNQHFQEREGLHLFAQPVAGRESGTKAEVERKASEKARRALIEKAHPRVGI